MSRMRSLNSPSFSAAWGRCVYLMCLVWIFYMALEPYVRRIWPEMVISWSRLLAGRWFDPLVGRDVLAGARGNRHRLDPAEHPGI